MRNAMLGSGLLLRRWALALALLAGTAVAALAQASEPIGYTLRFPAPHTHYVEVEARVPTGGAEEIELMMAVWTPGSYLVREYEQYLDDVEAHDLSGARLPIEKSRKNRWRVTTGGAEIVVVAYPVYSRVMSVRNNWVDADFALLNGAPTFLTLADDADAPRPHDVTLELPDTWSRTMTGLAEHPDGGAHHYRAADFDTLVDSPIVAGNPAVYEFVVGGTPHYLVNIGEDGVWDGPTSAADVERIVQEHYRMWGFLPYEKYLFLNIISESGGGVEHKNSTVIMASRWRTRTRDSYLGWLGTVSHEFFHTWNVKRLRPVELGPFDYENEVHSKSLWVAEGVTSYYGPLAMHRAGITTRDEYLDSLSETIRSLQTTPGRLVQPVEAASYDAWIKSYLPNENSSNTTISYYTKGAVIAFLLDAQLRQATNGERSLDDAMRAAYDRYADERGFTPEEFRAVIAETADLDLTAWFVAALETTAELGYTEAFDWLGLRFAANDDDDDAEGSARAWLGLRLRTVGNRLVVVQVRRGTPAYDAGVNVNDEILAIDDFRVQPGQWADRLRQYAPGDPITVLVSRRGRLRRLVTEFGEEPDDPWQIEIDPSAHFLQEERVEGWLGVP